MQLHGHNSIAVLTFETGEDYPRLTRKVLAELTELLASLDHEAAFRGVVIAANSKSFATGAEIEEIRSHFKTLYKGLNLG
jgi:enoyl-CoA hydratase/carnithine racemase